MSGEAAEAGRSELLEGTVLDCQVLETGMHMSTHACGYETLKFEFKCEGYVPTTHHERTGPQDIMW